MTFETKKLVLGSLASILTVVPVVLIFTIGWYLFLAPVDRETFWTFMVGVSIYLIAGLAIAFLAVILFMMPVYFLSRKNAVTSYLPFLFVAVAVGLFIIGMTMTFRFTFFSIILMSCAISCSYVFWLIAVRYGYAIPGQNVEENTFSKSL